MHLLAVFAELRVEGFVVLEEVPLVQERQEVAKIEASHLLSDKRSLERCFLNKSSDFQVGMTRDTIVEDK